MIIQKVAPGPPIVICKGYARDVAEPDGRGQRGRQGLEVRDLTVVVRVRVLSADDPDRVAEHAEVHESHHHGEEHRGEYEPDDDEREVRVVGVGARPELDRSAFAGRPWERVRVRHLAESDRLEVLLVGLVIRLADLHTVRVEPRIVRLAREGQVAERHVAHDIEHGLEHLIECAVLLVPLGRSLGRLALLARRGLGWVRVGLCAEALDTAARDEESDEKSEERRSHGVGWRKSARVAPDLHDSGSAVNDAARSSSDASASSHRTCPRRWRSQVVWRRTSLCVPRRMRLRSSSRSL